MPGRGEFCTTLPPPWGPRDGTPLETYEYLLLPAPLRPLRLHLGPRSVCDPCKNRLRSTPSIRSTTTPPISVSTAASSSVQKPPNGGYSRLLREALQWKMSKSFQLSQVSTSCLFPRHLRCLDHIASADVFSQSQIIGPSLFLCASFIHQQFVITVPVWLRLTLEPYSPLFLSSFHDEDRDSNGDEPG